MFNQIKLIINWIDRFQRRLINLAYNESSINLNQTNCINVWQT